MVAITTILYIEDNPVNVLRVERLLALRPTVGLLVANDGAAGLEIAATCQPNLILLDLHLPDMEGEQVLRLLQADPERRDIPVVVVSADAMTGDVSRLRAAGADDYLTKPFDLGQFLTIIDAVRATSHAAHKSEMPTKTLDARIAGLITTLTTRVDRAQLRSDSAPHRSSKSFAPDGSSASRDAS
jgi:CheY-like chemotaxis protein